jgi:hypothetical protein
VTWLELRPEGIPLELRRQPFVLWRAEPNAASAKPVKVPYRISEPTRRASATDPGTWGSFADACDAYGLLHTPQPFTGIAVILTAAAQICCIDLDRVLEGDTLDARAGRIVEAFASFTERSPSGTGLHIFGRGQVPAAIKGDQIEVYGDKRMICLTGHRWLGTPPTLHAVQPLLDRLRDAPVAPRLPYTGPSRPPPDDLGGALLARVQAWHLEVRSPLKPWSDGYLVELAQCPWAAEHTSGPGGAWLAIHASGAFDAGCQHAHCGGRRWRDFRSRLEGVA